MEGPLRTALTAARGAMECDAGSDIGPGYLDAVFLAIAAPGLPPPALVTYPRCLVAVELAAVERVLPLWEQQEWSEIPHRLLAEASRFLDGTFDVKRAEGCLDVCLSEFEELPPSEGLHRHVAEAARQVLAAALVWATLPTGPRLPCRDCRLGLADVEFDDWWMSSFAAVLYSGGAAWRPESDQSRRREFWEWWLGENVPAVAADGRLTGRCD